MILFRCEALCACGVCLPEEADRGGGSASDTLATQRDCRWAPSQIADLSSRRRPFLNPTEAPLPPIYPFLTRAGEHPYGSKPGGRRSRAPHSAPNADAPRASSAAQLARDDPPGRERALDRNERQDGERMGTCHRHLGGDGRADLGLPS